MKKSLSIIAAAARTSLTSLTIIAALTILTFSTASAQTSTFSDVPSFHDNFNAISYLQGEGTVEGYGDGTYKPGNTINRAEFVKIILESTEETPEGSDCFTDVSNEWYAPYICKAQDKGLVQGYPDGLFRPEQAINFAEASKVISEGLDIPRDELNDEYWFHKYVTALENELAVPTSVATFDEYVDRGEMAEMIYRVETPSDAEETNTYTDMNEIFIAEMLHTYNSCSELESAYLDLVGTRDGFGVLEEGDALLAPSTDTTAQKAAESTTTGGGSDDRSYSTTNIQVEGVDEADIVKTDGTYIYIVKGSTVRIVKSFPPDQLTELDQITFDDPNFWPRDMYVDGNKLVVTGSSSVPYPVPLELTTEPSIYPYYSGGVTKVYILDITDKANVTEFRRLSFDGNYQQSRKIDEMVYLVMNRYGYNLAYDAVTAEEILPYYLDTDDTVAKPLVGCDEIKYWPHSPAFNYLVVVGIPIDTANAEVASEVIVGESNNIYASRDNIYLAGTQYSYDYRISDESTRVYKFSLGRDNIDFIAKGKVPGRILNQFSMDEYDQNFRIATTKGQVWDDANPSLNNVYVLDGDMNMIGKVEGIAPGEQIHSSRFMGNKAYLVTFKKIDPFFVLDMSDPKHPKVVGSLKIPGYSDYMQPYDENHIIGIGKDTVEASEADQLGWSQDFAWYQGIKLALFDVTDPEKPKLMFSEVIGDRGTESPVLNDHKALLFDKEKNLLALPITLAEIPEELKDPNMPDSAYGEITFQGAYVYNLDLQNGYDLKGRITHYDENVVSDLSGFYWYGPLDINRILYIADALYTVSQGMVKSNDLNTLVDIDAVELAPGDDTIYYPEIMF